MNALQWTGEILTLLILIGGAFIAGVAIGDAKGGKR